MKSRSQQGHALSDAGGETVPASPLAFWHPLTCRCITEISPSTSQDVPVSVPKFSSSYKNTVLIPTY